jgi:filamentous hemagglutinin family protein
VALPKVSLALVAGSLLAAAAPSVASAQHITIDGRFSATQTLSGPYYAIGANLGKQVGSNLFHSFGQFGLTSPETAAFSGPATISNVIGRVTGGNPSSINGTIKSNIAGANVFLINPSGVVFGPNAKVNVSGAFHASTADYLKMSDGAKFRATNPDASTLSTAPPAGFGFLTASPAKISVNGSMLSVPSGQTLGLVGGPVAIRGGTLQAPAGTIHITSSVSPGDVPVDPRNTSGLTANHLGRVDIKSGSTLTVDNSAGSGNGGSIFVRAGALAVNGSTIVADNFGSGSGGLISLSGKTRVALTNGTLVRANTPRRSSGSGGSIALRGEDRVVLSGGTLVQAGAEGTGSGGGVVISTAPLGSISLDDAFVLTGSIGPGPGGPLSLATGRLKVTNGSEVASIVSGDGNAGAVTVTAGSVVIDGRANQILETAIASRTGDPNTGASGIGTGAEVKVDVGAGGVTILGNGEIASTTFGPGNAGSILMNVNGPVSIDGTSAVFPTGLESVANPTSTGKAGALRVNAASLSLTNGGQISASTAGLGPGGDVTVQIAGDIVVTGGATGSSRNPPGISASSIGRGDSGSITVSAVRLLMSNGAAISTQASTANGGNITLNVSDLVYLLSSRITASVNTETGNGGNIMIDPQLVVLNHSSIIATAAEGRGGNITINAGAFIPSADSMVDASSQLGISGTILITSPRVDVNGALVVLSSELRGHAAVLREACAARDDRPVSSLVEAGRGGLPQDPEATLPALYIADRDLDPNRQPDGAKRKGGSAPLRTTVRLTMPCR